MNNKPTDFLIRQFETTCKLANYHLEGLTTEECLWRPAPKGLHVYQVEDGKWFADWPESEDYGIGPASIGWLTWHIGFWWSMVLNHSFGDATLARQDVTWPGEAENIRACIHQMQDEWREAITQLTQADLRSKQRTKWPFQNRPFGDVVAWVNLELTKNAAEIGYARFLYAVSFEEVVS